MIYSLNEKVLNVLVYTYENKSDKERAMVN